jgi:hypothetical protein
LLQLVPVIENKSAEASNMAFPKIFFIVLLVFLFDFDCKSRLEYRNLTLNIRQI